MPQSHKQCVMKQIIFMGDTLLSLDNAAEAHPYSNNFQSKLGKATFKNQASCSIRPPCPSPSCVCSVAPTHSYTDLHFVLFVVTRLDVSVLLFLGCFAMYAVVAKAGRTTFPPGLSSHCNRLSLAEGTLTHIYLYRTTNRYTHCQK